MRWFFRCSVMTILNIAGYKFVTFAKEELAALRAHLLAHANELQLKGTLLLSTEGVNVALAGTQPAIETFVHILRQEPRLHDITFRQSYSAEQPFKRMKIKIKKEIITLHQPDICPVAKQAPSLSPQAFKTWLDEKRDITILDTRNDYEVHFGTFDHAQHLDLQDFSEFPDAINDVARDKPIVMFCTGGIRCEKAALVMLEAGYSEVYQLAGGILNYFAEVGGAHYRGDCFVFDQRVAVNPQLNPTGKVQCQQCFAPAMTNTCDLCAPLT